jgi:chromosome segregation ATPase
MTEMLLLGPDSIRETFREWHAERESLDAQLAESLSALSAYQSHLDTWQQELAQKRDELRKAREQFDADQAAAEKSKAHLEGLTVEVSELRDKISSLNVSLTDRTEELHAQAKRRDELVAELEASRAREKELQAALEERTRAYELEREKWETELRQIRDEATRRGLEASDGVYGQRPRSSAGAVRSCRSKWRRFAGR